jgi:serine/threonine protein kinase
MKNLDFHSQMIELHHDMRFADTVVIAEGSNTYICQAFDSQTRTDVAIKVPLIGCQQTAVEAAILQKLNHPAIIQLMDVISTESGPALVLPYARGGDLFKLVVSNNGLSESSAMVVMVRLLAAVAHCHEHGIWHRDIKLENILLMTDGIQDTILGDFGYAIEAIGECRGCCSGSVEYAAPEIWKRSPYTEKVDIWSLGVTLYTMLAADYPYATHENDPITSINEGLAELLRNLALLDVSAECCDLLEKMLEIDPARRISAAEALEHEWFAPLGQQTLKRPSSPVTEAMARGITVD